MSEQGFYRLGKGLPKPESASHVGAERGWRGL